jgi:alanine racemase
MRFTATSPRRVAVLPIGYGDGYPRLRNQGHVLLRGRPAPVVGANAMDATMVDVTEIPDVGMWEEATLLGRSGSEEITAHDLARWCNTVSYQVLTGFRARLPRVYGNS